MKPRRDVQVAVKEKTIPKTTSGKIQRRKTRALLHDGGLDVVHELSGAASDGPASAAACRAPPAAPSYLLVPSEAPPLAPGGTETTKKAAEGVVAASEKPAAIDLFPFSSGQTFDDSGSSGSSSGSDHEVRARTQRIDSSRTF